MQNKGDSGFDALFLPSVNATDDTSLRLDDTPFTAQAPNPTKRSKGPKKPKNNHSGLWISLAVAFAVGAVAYAAHKPIAAALIEDALKKEGVPSEVTVRSIGFGHLNASVALGAKTHSDVSIKTLDLDYGLNFFGGKSKPFIDLKSVRATGVEATLSLTDKGLNYGSLNGLIAKAQSGPKQKPIPQIVIEAARVRLNTDYGQFRFDGGVSLKDGRITYLTATLPKTHFAGARGEGDLLGGQIRAESKGADRLHFVASADVDTVRFLSPDVNPVEDITIDTANWHFQGLSLRSEGVLAYANTANPHPLAPFFGPIEAQLALKAGAAQNAGANYEGLEAQTRFDGTLKAHSTQGGLDLQGRAQVSGRADVAQVLDIDSQSLRLEGQDLAVRALWQPNGAFDYGISGPITGQVGALRQNALFVRGAEFNVSALKLDGTGSGFSSALQGQAKIERVGQGDLSADGLWLDLSGTVAANTEGYQADLTTDAHSDSAHYAGLKALAEARQKDLASGDLASGGPSAPQPVKKDVIIALDRAFERFGFKARGVKVGIRSNGQRPPSITIGLKNDIVARFYDGAVLEITPQGQQTLIAHDEDGAFAAHLSGGEQPALDFTATKVRFSDPARLDLIQGQFGLTGTVDYAPAEGVQFVAKGAFHTNDALEFITTLDGPVKVTVAKAMIGSELRDISLDLYQTGQTFIRQTPTGFYLNGHFANLTLNAPNEKIGISAGEGDISLVPDAKSVAAGTGGGKMTVSLKSALMTDALKGADERFYPLFITGTLVQDPLQAFGAFSLSSTRYVPADPKAAIVGQIELKQDVKARSGQITVRSENLNFEPSGLRIGHLIPFDEGMWGKATGRAQFDGQFSWQGTKVESRGHLSVPDMSLKTATHMARGIRAEIDFTSLAPLKTAEAQHVRMDALVASASLRDFDVNFTIGDDILAINGVRFVSDGGEIRFVPMQVALGKKAPISGALEFDHLDAGKVIEGTELSKSLKFQGTLSGRIPFQLDGQKVSIFDGVIKSDGPGRISIPRQGVTDLDGGQAVATAEDNKKPDRKIAPQSFDMSDLAYQAMEHLAFETLDGTLNSLPNGVLDMNFHLKGKFDPPQKQRTEVSLYDFITGKWVNKPIKLQSDAPIELYLNVPINLDEMLNDLYGLNVRTAR